MPPTTRTETEDDSREEFPGKILRHLNGGARHLPPDVLMDLKRARALQLHPEPVLSTIKAGAIRLRCLVRVLRHRRGGST